MLMPARLAPRRTTSPWSLIIVVMVGNFMGPLNSSIGNVALPYLMSSFGADVTTIEWVVTGYMLGYSLSMPLAGWLADTFGRRRIYLLGLTAFTGFSFLLTFAWSTGSLITLRILQAAGAGMVSPTSMAIITDQISPAERGRALGVWGLGMMLGPALGPWVGGYLIDQTDSWQAIFLLGLPVGIVGLILAYLLLPHDEERRTRPFDIVGFVALTAALTTLLIPLSEGERVGWDDPWVRLSFVCAAVCFAFFLWWDLRTPSPLLDLSLFRERVFSAAVGLRAVLGLAYYIALFLLPLFTQQVLGWTAYQSGAVLVPAGLAMAALMPISGALSDRIGSRILVIAGMCILAYGTWLFHTIDLTWSTRQIAVDALVRNAALGLLFIPLTNAALRHVPRHRTGNASGIINTVWQVGGSLGVALGQTYLARQTDQHYAILASTATMARPAVAQYVHQLQQLVVADHLAASPALLLYQLVVRNATVDAYGDTFLLATVVIACAVPLALLLGRRSHTHAH